MDSFLRIQIKATLKNDTGKPSQNLSCCVDTQVDSTALYVPVSGGCLSEKGPKSESHDAPP